MYCHVAETLKVDSFAFDIVSDMVEADPAESSTDKTGMQDIHLIQMQQILNREHLYDLHKIVEGVLPCEGVNVDQRVGTFRHRNRMDDVKNDFLEVLIVLTHTYYDEKADITVVPQSNTQLRFDWNRNDHFLGRLFKVRVKSLLFELPKFQLYFVHVISERSIVVDLMS